MSRHLERILIATQVTLLIVKITDAFYLPWVWALAPLWGPLVIIGIMLILREFKPSKSNSHKKA